MFIKKIQCNPFQGDCRTLRFYLNGDMDRLLENAVNASLMAAIQAANIPKAGPCPFLTLPIGIHSKSHYFNAISDMKLKYWNQTSALLYPASVKRSMWTGRFSGIRTFSKALRFWLISRSL